MNTGTSGSVSSITPAETRSIDATRTSTATGTVEREHDLRQVAGERRLERVDAGDRERGDLGALGTVERRRLIAQPPLDELEPEPRQHVGRGAPARRPRSPRRPPRGRRRPDEQDERRRPGRARHVRRRRGRRRARSGPPARGRAARRATPSTASAASRARAARARRSRRGSSGRTRLPGAGLPRDQIDRVADVLAAQPGAEHVVGPALVEQDHREENGGEHRHHGQRVVAGGGVVDREAVPEVGSTPSPAGRARRTA